MIRCAFTPYEGNKPYIFVSYAHKDSDRVFPVLEELDRRGYRVWYDDGIAPGSEWPENIAQHLDGCALCLAFISPASIASANCRREVTFALSKWKPFLGILLEKTEMSLGMEMQLSAQQCIMKYTYQSQTAFFDKVCSCPDLKPCLGAPKAVPAAVAEPKPAPAPAPVKEKMPTKPLDKKLMGIIAGVAAAVLLLTVVLVAVLGGDKPDDTLDGDPNTSQSTPPEDRTEPTDSSNEPGDTNETAIYYSDRTITAADVEKINRQTHLDQLTFQNCVFQEDALEMLEIPTTVSGIHILNCQGSVNLKSLENLSELRELELVNSDMKDAMLPDTLTATELRQVDLSQNLGITDLTFLAGCTKVEHINFSFTGVTSVEALRGMENLYEINGSHSKVTDLSPMMALTGVRVLHMADCGIEAIETPCYSLYLEDLNLAENKLTSIEAFQYCTVLGKVDLSYNDLQGVSMVLEKSAETLEVLLLAGNTHLNSNYLGFLKQCAALRELSLDGMWLFDLDCIEGLKLRKLSANNCSIDDISVLKSYTDMDMLSLAGNHISDLSPLSNLESCPILDLSFNSSLRDVSALPDIWYDYLNLTNEYLDWSTVANLLGDVVVFAAHPNMFTGNLFVNTGFSRYGVVACPLDYVVQVEKALGKDRVTFVDDDIEYIALLEEAGLDCRYLYVEE